MVLSRVHRAAARRCAEAHLRRRRRSPGAARRARDVAHRAAASAVGGLSHELLLLQVGRVLLLLLGLVRLVWQLLLVVKRGDPYALLGLVRLLLLRERVRVLRGRGGRRERELVEEHAPEHERRRQGHDVDEEGALSRDLRERWRKAPAEKE